MDVNLVDLAMGTSGGRVHKEGPATKQWQGLFVKEINTELRQITAVASTGSVDRDGEIVLPSAFKKCLAGYMRNPVILAGHQHKLSDGRSPVVGKCLSAKITKNELQIVVEFAKTSLAGEYWDLYRDGFQKAFSVGFKATEWHRETVGGRAVPVCKKVDELYEISCVPVPANPDALSRSAKRKRDFIANKRREISEETAEDRKVDQWCKRLDLWEDATADERKELFTAEEIAEFSKLDRDAEDFAAVIYGEVFELSAGSDLIPLAVGDDYEDDTGTSLVELALGR